MDFVDPALVEVWLHGWSTARGAPPPVPFPGGLRVDVGTPTQRVRYVLYRPHAELINHIATAETAPGAFIKVCASAEAVAPSLPAGWMLDMQRYMMITRLDDPHQPGIHREPRAPNQWHTARQGQVLMAEIRDYSGSVAAKGRIALVGTHAVLDSLVTEPAHRRRGLGTAIVNRLMRAAVDAGATTGLLVATPEGRALYATIGWRVLTPYTSAYNG